MVGEDRTTCDSGIAAGAAILVTGITGHTGRHFIDRLSSDAKVGLVRCVVRESSDVSYLVDGHLGIEVELARGDCEDIPFLVDAMRGVDTVVHIAGIQCSREVYAAAVAAEVDWLILVHTTGRFSKYRSASSEYAEIEDSILTRTDEIDVTVLRPTMIYGSRSDRNMYQLIDYLRRHRFFPVFGRGSNLMQPVLARDLGAAYYDVLVRPAVTKNKEYDLSGGTVLTYREILDAISRELSRRNVFVTLPIALSVALVRAYNRVVLRPRVSVEQVLRMNEDKAYSHASATADFGFAPTAFAEGIRDEVAQYLRDCAESTTRIGEASE